MHNIDTYFGPIVFIIWQNNLFCLWSLWSLQQRGLWHNITRNLTESYQDQICILGSSWFRSSLDCINNYSDDNWSSGLLWIGLSLVICIIS